MVKIIINILFFSILPILQLYGFSSDSLDIFERDSVWNLQELNADTLDFNLNFEVSESHGWFPDRFDNSYHFGINFFMGDNNDMANNIRPESFSPTKNPFSSDIPIPQEDRRIMEPGSRAFYTFNEYSGEGQDYSNAEYPRTGYWGFGLDFLMNLNLPFSLRFQTQFIMSDGLLFTEDKSKSFLNNGKKKRFNEIGVVYLEEMFLNAGIGVQLPVYGGFVNMPDMQIASYYYIFSSINLDYAVLSQATQYMQIADAKNELRYDNLQDTLRLISEESFSTVNRFRPRFEFGFGWNLIGSSVGLGLEIFGSIPLESVLDDAYWRQYKWGIKISLNYNSFF